MRLLLLAATLASAQPPDIHWRFGPAALHLTASLTQSIPSGWVYAQTSEMHRFLQATGNPPTGNELAVIALDDLSCFAVLSRLETARDNTLEEYTTEPDGRQVVILTRTSKHGLQYEVVAERRDEKKARQAADSLLSGLAAVPAFSWQPAAALFILAALGFWLYRQRGL